MVFGVLRIVLISVTPGGVAENYRTAISESSRAETSRSTGFALRGPSLSFT